MLSLTGFADAQAAVTAALGRRDIVLDCERVTLDERARPDPAPRSARAGCRSPSTCWWWTARMRAAAAGSSADPARAARAAALLEATRLHRLEGAVAAHRRQPYRAGCGAGYVEVENQFAHDLLRDGRGWRRRTA